MSMETSYLGAYWGSRRESAAQCSERLVTCLARLAELDPALGNWFRRGVSKAAATAPVGTDRESLSSLLAGGRNRKDFTHEAIEELGFSFALWNGASPFVALSGVVGAFPSFEGVLNNVVLDFPPPEADALHLFEPPVAELIFETVVAAWEPTWTTWTTPTLRGMQGSAPREPVIGWMTYLAGQPVVKAPGAAVRAFEGGILVKCSERVLDVGDQGVLSLRRHLKSAGLIHPII